MLPVSWYEPALLTSTSSAPPPRIAASMPSTSGLLVGDVEDETVGPATRAAKIGRHALGAVAVDVGHEHVGAGGGEHGGDRLPDPRRRTRHERHLAVEREQPADRRVHAPDAYRAYRCWHERASLRASESAYAPSLTGAPLRLGSVARSDGAPVSDERVEIAKQLFAGWSSGDPDAPQDADDARRRPPRHRQRDVRGLAGDPRLLRHRARQVGRPAARARRVLGQRQRAGAALRHERDGARTRRSTVPSTSARSGRSR